ncbi:2-deoxyribose-5-phosphate aldolase, partial [Clostridium perfringens]|nr:2-deoxyribose-5-phosphate aldolase [Clostridium perfringens]
CGDKILKVIIETCLLTEDEKIELCNCVTKAGADFIKTSTGFSTGGATIEDIELFRKNVGKDVKIKAAGGVKSIEKAEEFIDKGASRLGTSSIIKIMNNEEVKGY